MVPVIKNRFIFAAIAAILISASAYAVYAVFGTLGSTEKHLSAQTQSLVIDLARTEIHNTTYQNAAKAYFLNPSEEQKAELEHLNNVLRSRQILIQPKALRGHFSEEIEKSLDEEFRYFDDALEQLSLLLGKPGLLKTEQKEIENNLASVNASIAYIYTESVIAIHKLSIQQQSALRNLFRTILFLSGFLVVALLALAFFMLKFRKKNQQLRYEVDVKDRFFSIIVHDLKGPFTALLGMTQMMSQLSDNLSKEKLVEYSSTVHEAGEQVFDLLKNLLEWSRLQMTGAKLYPETVQLDVLVQDSVDILTPIATEKNISLTTNICKTNTFADPEMVRTVIRNLISNALKFTASGGVVEVSSFNVGNMVQVTVSDTGIGMTDKQAKNIFSLDKKTSTPGTAGEQGTGLGRPLCKDMIERNGGRIWAKGTPGEGAQFDFTLPIDSSKN